MPTVHMIHGYLGAGKTTFARQLETDLPAMRFTFDHWMTHLYGEDPPTAAMPDMKTRVLTLLEKTWADCVRHGIDTVLDLNFWSLEHRDRTRQMAQDLGATPVLYQMSVSDAEAWSRIEKRNHDLQGSFFISPNTFEVLKAQFEPLTPEEREAAITPSV